MAQHDKAQVKALTFDVFGTVVDWRGGYSPSWNGAQSARLT